MERGDFVIVGACKVDDEDVGSCGGDEEHQPRMPKPLAPP